MKRLAFRRDAGIKRVFAARPASSSTSTHPKFILGAFWNKTLEGKLRMRKVGAQDLTIQNLQTQVIEKKLWKEHGVRKEGDQDLTIQSSQLQVIEKKLWNEKGWEK